MATETPRPRISPGLRRTLRGLVSALTAIAVVLITGAVLASGLLNPAPAPRAVPAQQVDIGAGPLTLVCPDVPLSSTGDAGADIDYDAEFSTDTDQSQTRAETVVTQPDGAAAGTATLTELGESSQDLSAGPDGLVGTLEQTTGAAVLRAEPAEERTPLGAATAVVRAESGDLRGLSAAACLPPSSTQWLVGGATRLGSSARLLLTNAGQTPVTANVEVWGELGPLESGAQILVPPDESRSLLLETLSLEERLAVRITADGGQIAAAIQDSALSGVVPAGTDMVTTTADPATRINIGPVHVGETEVAENPPVLRVVNPSRTQANVSVDLFTESGPIVLSGAQDQVLEPGTVTDISLAGIDPGALSVQVISDVPVTGSVLRTVVGQAGELDPDEPVQDRAWIAAQAAPERGVLAVPGELADTVSAVLANPLPQTQQVRLTPITRDGTRGEVTAVEVEAGSATVVDPDQVALDEVIALEISGESVLATAMVGAEAQDGPMLSMLNLTPDAAAEQQVQVRLGAS